MQLLACPMDPLATSATPAVLLRLCNAVAALLRVVVEVSFTRLSLRFPAVLSASAAIPRNAALVYSDANRLSRLSLSRCSAAALFISHAIPLSRTLPITRSLDRSLRCHGLRAVTATSQSTQAVL